MALVFWDIRGVVHHEFLPKGRTINKVYYCDVLDRVHKAIKKETIFAVVFQQDNARPHTAKLTKEKLAKLGWEVLNHPPYSPDLAPSDFHLFRSMANKLNNEQMKFKNETEAKRFVNKFFKNF